MSRTQSQVYADLSPVPATAQFPDLQMFGQGLHKHKMGAAEGPLPAQTAKTGKKKKQQSICSCSHGLCALSRSLCLHGQGGRANRRKEPSGRCVTYCNR